MAGESRPQPVGPVKKLALEAVGTAVFLAMLWAFYDLQSPASSIRLFVAEERDLLREEWAQAVETLRFRNAVKRTINNLTEGVEP